MLARRKPKVTSPREPLTAEIWAQPYNQMLRGSGSYLGPRGSLVGHTLFDRASLILRADILVFGLVHDAVDEASERRAR